MTNRQKQIAFRIAGHVALALGVFSVYKTHSGWGALALVLGVAAMVLAVAEVMAKADAEVTGEVAAFKRSMELIRAVADGLKPKPPGMEVIREGRDPVERR